MTQVTVLALMSRDSTDVVLITTPSTTDADLAAALAQATGSSAPGVSLGARLPAGSSSTVTASGSFHAGILPALLSAHDQLPQAFTGVRGGGEVVAVVPPSSDGLVSSAATTAVTWTLSGGRRVVTVMVRVACLAACAP